MKKIIAVLALVVAMMGIGVVFNVPVFAVDCMEEPEHNDCKNKCTESIIISNTTSKKGKKYYCDDGQGGGIFNILNIILDVMTYGVGILGVLGIVLAGIQYATAADNEQKMAKAKKRIIDVVIGLAIYAVMYLALKWLLPGGLF